MKRSKIAGMGFYVPDNVVTNEELSQRMNTTNEWIIERTGIQERRHVVPGEDVMNYQLAVEATKKALDDAKLGAEDIDLIIYGTLSPDYVFPGDGVLLQRSLPFRNIAALDIRAQCSGFVYGLSVADQFIKTGMYKNILLVGSEIHSGGLDFSDHGRHVAVIFGDGAGAIVVSATDEEDKGVLSTHLHSQGEHAEELAVLDPGFYKKERASMEMYEPGGSAFPVMNGQFVFKNAVVRFQEVIKEALDENGLSVEDIDLLLPHQANLRISQFIQQKMRIPEEKVFNTIMKYGNTTAASIPIGLCEARAAGKIKEGDLICLAAFGSGFTWASALIRW
ncbi:MAG: beta-ketoacyl-ACP synthase III [Bacteroidota bacterium]